MYSNAYAGFPPSHPLLLKLWAQSTSYYSAKSTTGSVLVEIAQWASKAPAAANAQQLPHFYWFFISETTPSYLQSIGRIIFNGISFTVGLSSVF